MKKVDKKKLQINGRKKFKTIKKSKKTCRRQISFQDTTSEDEVDEDMICDDNEFDDVVILFSNDTEMCLVCGEYSTTELWYRCVACGKWAHSECSGFDSPENYKCDFCQKGL